MFDPYARHAARMRKQRRRELASRLCQLYSRAAKHAKTTASPFKVGDYVAGDDPFNGCQEGVVAVIKGSSVGLHTVVPRRGAVVYYDYRQLRKPW
ncbi:hypothetical protein [Arthrobacter bambusae]|uniref:hypothetical protein n=1 Tax=Arthrobacter bambusae TaxID=1338426 RepID=UPI002781327B|nr:hypothetical protein [Arthrobacter bambusae]MDQ0212396.1 hypothetical protein [Arthrobacter bambusae]MDQ0236844.1 hypothetical protein [Arthrobacter bambusae]